MGRNILYILLLAVGISVQDVKAYEYTDSLTSITLTLPDSADIEHKQGFQRARIKLEKSDIDIYSMKSQNGTQFSWERVNSFDDNRKYGELVRYERMPNGIDGWIRYYSAKDKRGRQYTTCVVLLRGKNYAFYMTESVYNEEDLSITDILETASFPTEFNKKKILVPSWLAWTMITAQMPQSMVQDGTFPKVFDKENAAGQKCFKAYEEWLAIILICIALFAIYVMARGIISV